MAYDPILTERVRAILGERDGFSERKMFGGISFLIHGNMCCGVMKTDLYVRLAAEQVVSALARPHTRPMEFTGKPMKSMLIVDSGGTDTDRSLRDWVESAYKFARAMPEKNPAKQVRRKLRGA